MPSDSNFLLGAANHKNVNCSLRLDTLSESATLARIGMDIFVCQGIRLYTLQNHFRFALGAAWSGKQVGRKIDHFG